LVSVSKDSLEDNAEEYRCPLFVRSVLPKPGLQSLFITDDSLDSSSSKDFHGLKSGSIYECNDLVLFIPMETAEDVEDCKMSGVSLVSQHKKLSF
jgi:hypothetical protein